MKKRIIIPVIIAIITLCSSLTVSALTPAEQTIQEYFQANDEVKTDSNTVSHSSFSAGNNVDNNNTVEGILFSAANNLRVNGVSEYALLAGNNVNVNAPVTKDLLVAGNIININAETGRDLYAIGSSVTLNKTVQQNAFIGGERVYLADDTLVNGNLQINASEITLGNNVKIAGLLSYNKDAKISNLNAANYGLVSTYENLQIEGPTPSVQSKIFFSLFKFISALVIFCLITLLFPRIPQKFTKITASGASVAKQLGIGACALVLIPTVCFFLLFTIIGIPLALILLALYFIALYLSFYLAGTYLGHLILTKVFNAKANPYAAIIIGIALILLVSSVPFVGGAIALIAVCLGIGMILDLIFIDRKSK